jgi:hypothetical protein
MRHVVFDAVVLGANILRVDVTCGGEILVNSAEVLQGAVAIESKTGHADGVEELRGEPSPGVTGNGNMINVPDGQSGFGQAVPDRVRGKTCRVLHAIEAFFLDSRYQPAVTN